MLFQCPLVQQRFVVSGARKLVRILVFSTQFLHIFIVLLYIVSTVSHCMNKVYTNVD